MECHRDQTTLSSRPPTPVIPTAVEGSQPAGSKPATWHCQVPPEGDPSASLRMTGYGVSLGPNNAVIPTAKVCHPDRQSLSSRPPKPVIPTAVEGSQPAGSKPATWHCQVPPEGDPSASLRMTGYGVSSGLQLMSA